MPELLCPPQRQVNQKKCFILTEESYCHCISSPPLETPELRFRDGVVGVAPGYGLDD
jgi:hypothetical protein